LTWNGTAEVNSDHIGNGCPRAGNEPGGAANAVERASLLLERWAPISAVDA
jgi:hypothetical protein